VAAITVIGAAVAAIALDAAPTMASPVDAAYRAGLVALCALAGSRARRWSLLWASAIATAAGGVPLQLVAGAAALASVAMLVRHFRNRVLGAAIGAAVGLTVLELVRPVPFGATAAVAAIAVVPLLCSGVRRSGRGTRRVVAAGLVAAVLVTIAAVAGAAQFGLTQRDAVDSAITETRDALELASTEDPALAEPAFARAAASFEEIGRSADVWWLAPARLTPVIAPNLAFARSAAGAGAELNLVAADLATSVDQDALRAPTGGVDLTVLASVRPRVDEAVRQVDAVRAAVRASGSPWLVPPVRRGLDELLGELDGAAGTATTAQLAVTRIPEILGATGPRRYLMLLGNPAESRDIGGHIGNWAEIVADGGRLTIVAIGQPYDLSNPATTPAPTLTPGAYPSSLVQMRPQYFPQNWGATADFPTVASLARELYSQARPGAPIDGVIYADPAAFAALLTFTGPEPVPGTDLVLTPENAAQFLTSGQFSIFPTELEGNAVVSGLIEDVMTRFGGTQLPSPTVLADVLGPLVANGRLQFVSFDGADTPLLERLGLLGRVERPGSGDLLGVLTRNANPSKIDVHLQRSTVYDVQWDPLTGDVSATLSVTLTNDAPTTGLPAVVDNPIPGLASGTNRVQLAVLSPWHVDRAALDGMPTTFGSQQELRGVLRHSTVVDVPAGATRVVEFTLSGTVGPGTPYLLQWIGQPTAAANSTAVEVRSSGAPLAGGAVAVEERFDGAEDRLLTVRSVAP